MRSTTALLFLLVVAPSALAAPLPTTLLTDWQAHAAAVAAGDKGHVNNRPFVPAPTTPPSFVLALRRPIATAWLMSLGANTHTAALASVPTIRPASEEATVLARRLSTHSKAEAAKDTWPLLSSKGTVTATAIAMQQAPLTAKADEVDSMDSATQLATSDGETSSPEAVELSEPLHMEAHHEQRTSHVDTPCYYAQIRRKHNDMENISIVVVFMLVVVALELWDSNEEQQNSEKGAPCGETKLASAGNVEKQPLSIPASSIPASPLCRSFRDPLCPGGIIV